MKAVIATGYEKLHDNSINLPHTYLLQKLFGAWTTMIVIWGYIFLL